MLVEVQGAVFGYGSRAVVRVDHLVLEEGRCLGIFGPNGAGKTTLVRGITGLLEPMSGAVTHGLRPTGGAAALGRPLLGYASPAVRFAYMPQHRAMELHWPMTGLDAASLAVSARQRLGWVGDATAAVRAMMRRLDVEGLAGRPFARLSGGQQQRLLLAGAMASDPQVLVLDEPTDGLDVASTQNLLDLLRDFTAKGLCTVLISHEVEDLLYVCDAVAWLHPAESAERPSHVEVISTAGLAERVAGSKRKV